MSSSVTATRTAGTTDSRTTSIAILICGRHNNASVSKGGGGGSGSDGIPLVVWAQQQRIRQSPDDPWKHTLRIILNWKMILDGHIWIVY